MFTKREIQVKNKELQMYRGTSSLLPPYYDISLVKFIVNNKIHRIHLNFRITQWSSTNLIIHGINFHQQNLMLNLVPPVRTP